MLLMYNIQYSDMECCEMKGYLTYLILWNLSQTPMNGAQITREFEKRRGTKPSPGTIYPALKELKTKDLITVDDKKTYSLTINGEKELKSACKLFCKIFYDAKEMSEFCK
jgi:PadR family transcriptional regulator, regulatory protein PadR